MSGAAMWRKAAAFAARAHRDQHRRDENTPYFSHPARVAMTVAVRFGCDDETTLAAAYLHDVIEDTTVDYDELAEHFGGEVADIVACLSKDPRVVEPEREKRYDRQLAAGPWQARLIKLADVYDNLADAEEDASRRTMLAKLDRAVAVAGEGPHIADAVAAVGRLRDAVRAELEGR